MHFHTARTTIDKLGETLESLKPPSDHTDGPYDAPDTDLLDLKVEYLGGRDVLAISVHRDHDRERELTVARVRVEEYGPDHRYFEAEGGAAMPPDAAGLVEDVRRTWALWYGQDGRPTTLWLYRDATGAVVGDPIHLASIAPILTPDDGVGPAARTVTIRRKDNGWDRFAFNDDDGHLVAEFTVDPRHVTVVHDRATPPEWIGHGQDAAAGWAVPIIEWMEKHPQLTGEGSALDNVLRLLDHAYEPGGCDDPSLLSAHTPGRRW